MDSFFTSLFVSQNSHFILVRYDKFVLRAKHQQPSSRKEKNYRVICFQKNLIRKKTNITGTQIENKDPGENYVALFPFEIKSIWR